MSNRKKQSAVQGNSSTASVKTSLREYQAIIAYNRLQQRPHRHAKWMSIAKELKKHAHEELEHALIIADQIDRHRGARPTATPKPVKLSKTSRKT